MSNYKNLPLSNDTLFRLNYEGNVDNYWKDIDAEVLLRPLEDKSYQQYDENDNDVYEPLKTVGDLMERHKIITGFELTFWEYENPQTGQ